MSISIVEHRVWSERW